MQYGVLKKFNTTANNGNNHLRPWDQTFSKPHIWLQQQTTARVQDVPLW
jgi:hypothetical protein